MDLCLVAERRTEMRISQRWWQHPALYILWIREGHTEEDMGEETGTEESEGERESRIWKDGRRENEMNIITREDQAEI